MEPTGPQPAVITNVADATWKYLWQVERPRFIIAVSLATLGLVLTIILEPNLVLFPIVLFIIWYGKVFARMQSQFMEQFAQANNFVYCPGEIPTQIYGKPFTFGHDHTFTDLVKGSIDNLPLEYFNYSYVTGYGRSRTTTSLTVMAINLGHDIPRVYAQSLGYGQKASLSQKLSAILETPIGANKLTFGNDFDKYYQVIIDPGTEVETLQIFEPDLMAQLIDQPVHFDFELSGQSLYIYTGGPVANKLVLDGFVAFARAISARFELETSNLD